MWRPERRVARWMSFAAVVAIGGCRQPRDDRRALQSRADEVVDALRTHDMARLAAFAHPQKGVRFSAYAFVHVDSDVVLTRQRLAGLWTDSARRVWGRFDGSGEPIRLTYPQYHARFVYNADFASAPRTAIDSLPLQHGNTPSNLRDAYPGAHWIELHVPGVDPKYGGMDWSSLWLVFEPAGTQWYLVGIVHGSWTI